MLSLRKNLFGFMLISILVPGFALGVDYKPSDAVVVLNEQPAQPISKMPSSAEKPNDTQKIQIIEAYGKTSMGFEENKGQSDEQVRFISRGQGYTLFLTPKEAVLVLSKQPSTPHKAQCS